MGAGSRNKGSKAELEAAEILRAWWSQIEPDVVFKRVPLSGGWADASSRGKFKTAGDLLCSSKLWPFSSEIKRREQWSWAPLLAGKGSPVWDWWHQAQMAAFEVDMEPLLLFRKSHEPWWAMVREDYASLLKLHTAGVDCTWGGQGRLDHTRVGAHPRAFPLEVMLAYPPSRFLPHAKVGGRRRAHG